MSEWTWRAEMGCAFANWPSDGFDPTTSEDERALWPRTFDRLFSVPPEPKLPARLIGGRVARHVLLWEGYFSAADALVALCEEDPRRVLRFVYPVMYNYRHGMEIGLKWILEHYGDSIGLTNAPRTHGLRNLWSSCRAIIENNRIATPEELTGFENLVAELEGADPTSTSFRYFWPRRPLSEEEQDALEDPHDRDDVVLDLATVRAVMTRAQAFLDDIDYELMNTLTPEYE